MIKKDKYILKEARDILSCDPWVRSDLALEGEFYCNYGVTPEEYIKKYGLKNELKKYKGVWVE